MEIVGGGWILSVLSICCLLKQESSRPGVAANNKAMLSKLSLIKGLIIPTPEWTYHCTCIYILNLWCICCIHLSSIVAVMSYFS